MIKLYSIKITILLFSLCILFTGCGDGILRLSGTVSIPSFICAGDTVEVTQSWGNSIDSIYTWMLGDSEDGNFEVIPGASDHYYIPVESDVDYYLKVIVSREDYMGTLSSNVSRIWAEGTVQPVITSIKVNPQTITLSPGGTYEFSAVVNGTGLKKEHMELIWTVFPSNHDTYIDQDGNLIIGVYETEETLIVEARSAFDSEKYAEAIVAVNTEVTEYIILSGTLQYNFYGQPGSINVSSFISLQTSSILSWSNEIGEYTVIQSGQIIEWKFSIPKSYMNTTVFFHGGISTGSGFFLFHNVKSLQLNSYEINNIELIVNRNS